MKKKKSTARSVRSVPTSLANNKLFETDENGEIYYSESVD